MRSDPRKIGLIIVIALIGCAISLGLTPEFSPATAGRATVPAAPAATPTKKAVRSSAASRYSEFSHSEKAHRMECSKCHKFPSPNWEKVRPAADAFPDITDYPKHDSCLSCHRRQFFQGSPPAICTICHTKPSPRNSERHPFPNPSEIYAASPKGKDAVSDFSVSFPHSIHVEIVSAGNRDPGPFRNASYGRPAIAENEESCSVCHQTLAPQGDSDEEYLTKPPKGIGDAFWLKKGTFKSIPTGHKTCFTCHSADTGIAPAPNDCAVCHKLKGKFPDADFDPVLASKIPVDDKPMLMAWRRRASSGTFRHEWFSHSELSCSTCHNVSTIETADPQTEKVAISSCATCHVTATSDDGGALNFEADARKADSKFVCTKCHITFGKLPIPETHLKALAAAKSD